ncbi:hypothetical protein [Endozoicomonas sp. ONNA2]|uniref:hypothetical protein n=1 Tax=Endozoicomonas sp. ONNA2 TaxID=2828741 RepID=UPI0021499487|nr:hypothetical protein [Endozoicomonas sp. ONNA2]
MMNSILMNRFTSYVCSRYRYIFFGLLQFVNTLIMAEPLLGGTSLSRSIGTSACDPIRYSIASDRNRAISFCENGTRLNGTNLTPLIIPWDGNALELVSSRDFQIRSCDSESCYWAIDYDVSGEIDGSNVLMLTHESGEHKIPISILFRQVDRNRERYLPNVTAIGCDFSRSCPFSGSGLFEGDDQHPNQKCLKCLSVRIQAKVSRKALEETGLLKAGAYQGNLELRAFQATKTSLLPEKVIEGLVNSVNLTIRLTVPDLVRINHLDNVELHSPHYQSERSICIYRNSTGTVQVQAHGENDYDGQFRLKSTSESRDCRLLPSDSCVNYSVQLKQTNRVIALYPNIANRGFKGSGSMNCIYGDRTVLIFDVPKARSMPANTYRDTLYITVSPD